MLSMAVFEVAFWICVVEIRRFMPALKYDRGPGKYGISSDFYDTLGENR